MWKDVVAKIAVIQKSANAKSARNEKKLLPFLNPFLIFIVRSLIAVFHKEAKCKIVLELNRG